MVSLDLVNLLGTGFMSLFVAIYFCDLKTVTKFAKQKPSQLLMNLLYVKSLTTHAFIYPCTLYTEHAGVLHF